MLAMKTLKNGLSMATVATVLGLSALSTGVAHAHIDMYGAIDDRGGNEKTKPCGGPGRGTKVYTFEPGATISLGVTEEIPHDGYFRISFDNDGFDDFKDPVSINPVNPNRYGTGRKCQGAADNCGKSDFCNVVSTTGGPSVLWDNLDPHLGSSSKSGKQWNWTVTLPNVECTNCTLQVQQIMEDPAGGFHGPFDGQNDLYYRCIDIVLKKGAGKTPGTVSTPAVNKGIDCLKPPAAPLGRRDAGASRGDAGVGPSALVYGDGADAGMTDDSDNDAHEKRDDDSGCSIASRTEAGSMGWDRAALFLALGTLLVRRTRRRQAPRT